MVMNLLTKMKAENGNWETKTLTYFYYLLLRQSMWTNTEVRVVQSSPASLADLTQGPLQEKKNKLIKQQLMLLKKLWVIEIFFSVSMGKIC